METTQPKAKPQSQQQLFSELMQMIGQMSKEEKRQLITFLRSLKLSEGVS